MTTKSATLPFDLSNGYSVIPEALFEHYLKLPDFRLQHVVLYTRLLKYWNPQYGYAFPTTEQLARDLDCTEETVRKHRHILEKYGLVETEPHPYYGNLVYYVKQPIENEQEFYSRFPEAIDYFAEREEMRNRRRESKAEYKRKLRENRG